MFGLFETGLQHLYWGHLVMILIAAALLYMAIKHDFEPLLLIPIGFGILLVNLPLSGLTAYAPDGTPVGIFAILYNTLIKTEIIPIFIFFGLGALTDFSPVIANPKTLLLGAAAQFGVYAAFFVALLIGFSITEAASIGIIGGADGPTTIFLASQLAPQILGPATVAAYSYMAMVPIIQPPIIRLLTTQKERAIYMKPALRKVAKWELILFPFVGAIVIILLVPPIAPLLGMFMLGNLLQVSGVTKRLADTAGGDFMNILTPILGVTVGSLMPAEVFLKPETLKIFGLGLVAFAFATAGGVMLGKLMNKLSKEPINPMIGAAGVSAVPMSARVVQRMGQKANPRSFLLMHAMGPNVAGVIGTAVAAGLFLSMLK